MVITCVFRHNSRCEKPVEPPRFVASITLRRHPGGKPATACYSGPSGRLTSHLYQQHTDLFQAETLVPAVASSRCGRVVCLSCPETGVATGDGITEGTGLNRAGCNTRKRQLRKCEFLMATG